jgi:microcystin-dependent protein
MDGVLGEIRCWPVAFEPRHWAFCDGRRLPIAWNQALFSLIGTSYGGDGVTTFCLPDLRGRIPIGMGQGMGMSRYELGQTGGVEKATLTTSQLPWHNHLLRANSQPGTVAGPGGAYPAGSNAHKIYGATGNTLMTKTVDPAGANPQHDNMMPFLCCNYIICLEGYYPSRD